MLLGLPHAVDPRRADEEPPRARRSASSRCSTRSAATSPTTTPTSSPRWPRRPPSASTTRASSCRSRRRTSSSLDTKEQLEHRVRDLKLLFDLERAMGRAHVARGALHRRARRGDARVRGQDGRRRPARSRRRARGTLYVIDERAKKMKRVALPRRRGAHRLGDPQQRGPRHRPTPRATPRRDDALDAARRRRGRAKTALVVPLEGEHDAPMGAIAIYNKRGGRPFSRRGPRAARAHRRERVDGHPAAALARGPRARGAADHDRPPALERHPRPEDAAHRHQRVRAADANFERTPRSAKKYARARAKAVRSHRRHAARGARVRARREERPGPQGVRAEVLRGRARPARGRPRQARHRARRRRPGAGHRALRRGQDAARRAQPRAQRRRGDGRPRAASSSSRSRATRWTARSSSRSPTPARASRRRSSIASSSRSSRAARRAAPGSGSRSSRRSPRSTAARSPSSRSSRGATFKLRIAAADPAREAMSSAARRLGARSLGGDRRRPPRAPTPTRRCRRGSARARCRCRRGRARSSPSQGDRGRAGDMVALRRAEPRQRRARRDDPGASLADLRREARRGLLRALVARRAARLDVLRRRRALAGRAATRRSRSPGDGLPARSTSSSARTGERVRETSSPRDEGAPDRELEGGWAVAIVEQRVARRRALGAHEQGALDRDARSRAPRARPPSTARRSTATGRSTSPGCCRSGPRVWRRAVEPKGKPQDRARASRSSTCARSGGRPTACVRVGDGRVDARRATSRARTSRAAAGRGSRARPSAGSTSSSPRRRSSPTRAPRPRLRHARLDGSRAAGHATARRRPGCTASG